MRQVIQNYKTGELKVEDVPIPTLRPGGVLVRNAYSLISTGTERTKIRLARSNLLEKARQRPDQVRQVLNNLRQEGLIPTYQKVMTRLDTPITLGYCSAGVVIEVGEGAQELRVGDRLACAGEGYASHSEVVYVPRNLCARVPDAVPLDHAAFAPLGAIALQGVRQARIAVGENVAVIGLGLVGLLTVQLLKASGCRVLGVDLDADKVQLAQALGAEVSICRNQPNLETVAAAFSYGYGVDAVIITASTRSTDPIELAGTLCREKGRVVVVGAVPVDVPRKDYYEKELGLCISRAFGPGSYDKGFVEQGIDYPYGYVRWTAQRNMEAFLNLVAEERINLDSLITHRFPIDEAPKAYDLLRNPQGQVLGIIFEYETSTDRQPPSAVIWLKEDVERATCEHVTIGVIGAGNFAQAYLLPNFRRLDGVTLRGVATATSVSATNASGKFGFAYCTCDYREILNDPEINCVVIATRHNLHARFSIEALKRGKTVWVEKPLALNEEQLREVIEAHKESRGRLMIGFNRRFSTFTQRVGSFFENRSGPLVMNYRVNAGPLPPEHWVHDAREGGGRVVGEVCHFVDLLQYLANSNPLTVYAETAGGPNKNMPGEDNVNIIIKFEDGSVGTISYSSIGDLSFPKERIEIFGQNSVAIVDNFKRASLVRDGRTTTVRRWWGRDMGYEAEVRAFAKALRTGSNMPINFEEIVLATFMTFKIIESARQGNPVEIDVCGWFGS